MMKYDEKHIKYDVKVNFVFYVSTYVLFKMTQPNTLNFKLKTR